MTTLGELRRDPNALAAHYTKFGVADRVLLTGHSHQAWPDVAEEGLREAFADAAEEVDTKWDRAFAKADEMRAGFRALLGDPHGDIALGASTHDLVIRFLSAMDLRGRPRIVSTDGEFHTLRRQLARLAEEGVEVVRVPATPVTTLAERVAAEVTEDTGAVLVSAVLFETSRLVPGLAHLADVCLSKSVNLVVDAYHALGAVPFALHDLGLTNAWVLGGGYKYLQLGEGNCFLRMPAHAQELRPVVTGWYAEFGALADERRPGQVAYATGSDRFAGATYDPTSHYRGARVFRFFAEQGLTPEFLREVSRHQVGFLAEGFDKLGLPDDVITRDRETPLDRIGGFLSLKCADAGALQAALAERGVRTDSRGAYLRFGPAPYLSDDQLDSALRVLDEVVRG
ncbi:kynureninase [Amycolatopsis regifaucium]|uniref:Kynureninase n=1 Tax=Amycolatopsis regifaucium TaxID=546365 RepID=A0A154M661_9PSEU|nr:kynureninase [Amycolatopsis regifaucium]KZB80036.1 kynureninase [Amycolatopsis regifaucium]OKA09595.1 kynureninase [Amycolatopsis regifaucium]SFH66062.1 Selenocysteine lyase/Cysteine desulfurase [Amycolatopsis regifaucium]